MTTLDASARSFPAASWAAPWAERLAAPVEGLLRQLADWNDARVTRRMLSRLSVRQLDDIGLCRDDIAAVSTRPLP